jgi:pyrimidine operon attenuation protein/uracil phosphoribosyltransferase
MNSKTILEKKQFSIIIDRLCYELIERHSDFENTAIIGLQPRGTFFARRIVKRLSELTKSKDLLYGELDISFYRDDFRRGNDQITPSEMKINFTVENKKVVLIDDVLYTGRSIRSALDALIDFGRPEKVELMVLIDRRYSRHLPIQPDYMGISVDTRANDKVKVEWKENGKSDLAMIISN